MGGRPTGKQGSPGARRFLGRSWPGVVGMRLLGREEYACRHPEQGGTCPPSWARAQGVEGSRAARSSAASARCSETPAPGPVGLGWRARRGLPVISLPRMMDPSSDRGGRRRGGTHEDRLSSCNRCRRRDRPAAVRRHGSAQPTFAVVDETPRADLLKRASRPRLARRAPSCWDTLFLIRVSQAPQGGRPWYCGSGGSPPSARGGRSTAGLANLRGVGVQAARSGQKRILGWMPDGPSSFGWEAA